MKFCDVHWGTLKAELDKAGLLRFVSPDGPEAMRRMNAAMVEERDGLSKKVENFEPLMQAHNMIVGQAMMMFGAPFMLTRTDTTENDGHRCPVCVALAAVTGCPHGEDPKRSWTEDEVLEEWTAAPVAAIRVTAVENNFIVLESANEH